MTKYRISALSLLSFILPFGLYVYHLAPTYIPIDSAEFTLCMKFWGLCHPPGFPLYVMAGNAFLAIFPFGEVIWRANLFSAIFGALTILLVFLTLVKLEVKAVNAFLGAFLLAVSTSFWEFSLSADVFTFGTFLVSLSLYLAFSHRKLLSLFALGLSASHFYLTAVLWPLYVWYFSENSEGRRIGSSENQKRILQLLIWVVVFGLGFFPQIILYFRMLANPEINWGHSQGFGGYLDYVRRKEFGSGFLLSNPSLVYSPFKNLRQIGLFLKTFLFEFGLILPVLSGAALFFSKIGKRREYILVFCSFLLYAFVQLFLLSTIDPGGENNPFQLNKFYLVPFVFGLIAAVKTLDYLMSRFFREFSGVFVMLLSGLVFIYFLVNWQMVSFRGNYFSRNLVLDALDQLPSGALAITVDHLIFFGALYEQKVNGLHADKTILYFPNEKNRDGEYYNPQIFSRDADGEFIARVEDRYSLGSAEKYVLSTISKNLERDIFILQGEFEYNFFRYLSGESDPWGLWIRIKKVGFEVGTEDIVRLSSGFRNSGFVRGQFFLKHQSSEASVYAISYYQSALKLASIGEYDRAVEFFNKSLMIDPARSSVQNDIAAVSRVRDLDLVRGELIGEKDGVKLLELAQGLFTIKNYKEAATAYEEIIGLGSGSAQVYNNAALAYANLGEAERAREYFTRALEIDPNFDSAKAGLKSLN